MSRRNPYYPGMRGFSIYKLDPVPPIPEPQEKRKPVRGLAADGFRTIKRRSRYDRPGDFEDPSEAARREQEYEDYPSYDEED